MSSWLRLDLPVERLPDLVISAEPDPRGGWYVRDERTRGAARSVIFGMLAAEAPVYGVEVR